MPIRPEFLALALAALALSCTAPPPRADTLASADAVLDALHAAAARADGPAYFELFTEDAVFIGTDATERWSVAQFRAYAQPYFSKGQGWTYVSTERHLSASERGDVVWFDERLQNSKYGEVRGSGVLRATPEGLRVAQYVLSIPVPNELAEDLVARVRAAQTAAPKSEPTP